MKKLLLPIITLIVGFGAGYLVFKCHSNDITKSPKMSIQFGGGRKDTSGRPKDFKDTQDTIPRQMAMDNISLFRKKFQPASYPTIKGSEGPFNGFFIDKASLDSIFAKNPNVTGISFYLGIHPYWAGSSSTQDVLSIYYTGAIHNPTPLYRFENPASSPIYEYVNPCPTACGSLAP